MGLTSLEQAKADLADEMTPYEGYLVPPDERHLVPIEFIYSIAGSFLGAFFLAVGKKICDFGGKKAGEVVGDQVAGALEKPVDDFIKAHGVKPETDQNAELESIVAHLAPVALEHSIEVHKYADASRVEIERLLVTYRLPNVEAGQVAKRVEELGLRCLLARRP
jgi:hypothetical protein